MQSAFRRRTVPPNPLRILVADDDDAMRELVSSVLAAQGFDVESVRDGTELLNHLDPRGDGEKRVDLVVSDVQMPGATGLDVLRWVRRRPDPSPPVILITAFGDMHLHRRARELGAADVIDKPFDMAQLCTRVERVLRCKPQASADPAPDDPTFFGALPGALNGAGAA
jgi:DNA-binding response OmpR family regulator